MTKQLIDRLKDYIKENGAFTSKGKIVTWELEKILGVSEIDDTISDLIESNFTIVDLDNYEFKIINK